MCVIFYKKPSCEGLCCFQLVFEVSLKKSLKSSTVSCLVTSHFVNGIYKASPLNGGEAGNAVD